VISLNKALKEIKKYRYTTIAIILFLLVLLVASILFNMFFGGRGKPVYGNRLDGIENVQVTENDFSKTSDTLKKEKIVVDAKGSLSGRILNYTITVKSKTKTSDAKALTKIILNDLSNEQKAYFDIQVFFVCEDETAGYPLIGYKNKEKKGFSY